MHAGRGAWLGWLDGHGSLLGDRGGGYDIGVRGLRYAARCADLGDDEQPLPRQAVGRFGPVREWPGILQGGTVTARITSFATDVLACAAAGDPVAAGIRDTAAGELAETLAAAVRRLRAGPDGVAVSWAGSVLRDTALREEFVRRLVERSAAARPRPPAGNALDGAVQLASDPRRPPASSRSTASSRTATRADPAVRFVATERSVALLLLGLG